MFKLTSLYNLKWKADGYSSFPAMTFLASEGTFVWDLLTSISPFTSDWSEWGSEYHFPCLFCFVLIFIYLAVLDLFFFLCWILVATCELLSHGMWDLVPWPGIEPGPLAIRAWSPTTGLQVKSLISPGTSIFKGVKWPGCPFTQSLYF